MLSKDYPVSVVCSVMDLARSSYYYLGREREEEELVEAIERVASEWPSYGSRRVARELRRAPYNKEGVGRKRVRRIMKQRGLCVRKKKKKRPAD